MRELLLYSGLQAVAWWFFIGHFTGKNSAKPFDAVTLALIIFTFLAAFLTAFTLKSNFKSNLILPIAGITIIPILLAIEKLNLSIAGLAGLYVIAIILLSFKSLKLQNVFGLGVLSLIVSATAPIAIYYTKYEFFPSAIFNQLLVLWLLTIFFLEPYFTNDHRSITMSSLIILAITIIAIFAISHVFMAFLSVILLLIVWYLKARLLDQHLWLIAFALLEILITFAL